MTPAEAAILATYCGCRMVEYDPDTANHRFCFDVYVAPNAIALSQQYFTPFGVEIMTPIRLSVHLWDLRHRNPVPWRERP